MGIRDTRRKSGEREGEAGTSTGRTLAKDPLSVCLSLLTRVYKRCLLDQSRRREEWYDTVWYVRMKRKPGRGVASRRIRNDALSVREMPRYDPHVTVRYKCGNQRDALE